MHAETHVGVHNKVCYCCPILTKIRMDPQIIVELPDIRFLEITFGCFRVVSCTRTDGPTERLQ
jgi:hypothetical protein